MAWGRCLIKPGGCAAAATGANRYENPTLGWVGLKAGNVGREEGDVSNAWRGAWRYSWPTELGTPVQANSASAGPSGNRKGVKDSSVCVTRPILFRPQTGSRSRQRITRSPSGPSPCAATNGQEEEQEEEEEGRRRRRSGKEKAVASAAAIQEPTSREECLEKPSRPTERPPTER